MTSYSISTFIFNNREHEDKKIVETVLENAKKYHYSIPILPDYKFPLSFSMQTPYGELRVEFKNTYLFIHIPAKNIVTSNDKIDFSPFLQLALNLAEELFIAEITTSETAN